MKKNVSSKKRKKKSMLSGAYKILMVCMAIGLCIGITNTRQWYEPEVLNEEIVDQLVKADIPNLKEDEVAYILDLQSNQEEPLTSDQIKDEIEWRRAEVIAPELP